jgi:hypothetical protein
MRISSAVPSPSGLPSISSSSSADAARAGVPAETLCEILHKAFPRRRRVRGYRATRIQADALSAHVSVSWELQSAPSGCGANGCSEFYLMALITMNGGTAASSVAHAEESPGRG